MKPLIPLIRWPLLVALALPLALAACSKQDDDELGSSQVSEAEQASLDTSITAKVNSALAEDEKLRATPITVDTHNGQVTLTGVVPDTQVRDRATVLASGIDGVKLVNNQMVIGRNG